MYLVYPLYPMYWSMYLFFCLHPQHPGTPCTPCTPYTPFTPCTLCARPLQERGQHDGDGSAEEERAHLFFYLYIVYLPYPNSILNKQ